MPRRSQACDPVRNPTSDRDRAGHREPPPHQRPPPEIRTICLAWNDLRLTLILETWYRDATGHEFRLAAGLPPIAPSPEPGSTAAERAATVPELPCQNQSECNK